MEDLSLIIQSAKEAFDQAATPAALEDAKAVYLGKNGSLSIAEGDGKTVHRRKTRSRSRNQ